MAVMERAQGVREVSHVNRRDSVVSWSVTLGTGWSPSLCCLLCLLDLAHDGQ